MVSFNMSVWNLYIWGGKTQAGAVDALYKLYVVPAASLALLTLCIRWTLTGHFWHHIHHLWQNNFVPFSCQQKIVWLSDNDVFGSVLEPRKHHARCKPCLFQAIARPCACRSKPCTEWIGKSADDSHILISKLRCGGASKTCPYSEWIKLPAIRWM